MTAALTDQATGPPAKRVTRRIGEPGRQDNPRQRRPEADAKG